MRLTLCLEGNGEGRVLANISMEEIVKMTITDDIEKSNFNPKMLKSATDLAYQCGYHQGRADAIDEFARKLYEGCNEMIETCSSNIAPISWAEAYADFKVDIEEIAEQLKEQICQ